MKVLCLAQRYIPDFRSEFLRRSCAQSHSKCQNLKNKKQKNIQLGHHSISCLTFRFLFGDFYSQFSNLKQNIEQVLRVINNVLSQRELQFLLLFFKPQILALCNLFHIFVLSCHFWFFSSSFSNCNGSSGCSECKGVKLYQDLTSLKASVLKRQTV